MNFIFEKDVERKQFEEYDRTVANAMLANFKVVFLDEYGKPVDGEYEQDELFFELGCMFEYLESLRVSGVTNMFGAAPYLQNQFGLDSKLASKVLIAWMNTYR